MIIVKAEIACGDTIEEAVMHSKDFAIRNGCGVAFDFNGVEMCVFPHSNREQAEKFYRDGISRVNSKRYDI